MKAFCVIGLALAISISTAVGNICSGRRNGDQLSNSADCGSYYVCDYGNPTLVKCGGGLLYDHKLGVCNWATRVSCGQIEQSPPTAPATKPTPATTPPTPPPTRTTPVNLPNANWPTYIPESHGDYYPGIKESKNTPIGYACTIDGFYFAPHPTICEQYFICENRRIHFHQCGAGIHWDYIYLQCDFPERSYCYSNNTQNSNNNPPAYLPVSGSPPVFIGVTAPVAIEFPISIATETEPTTVEPTTVKPTTVEPSTTEEATTVEEVPEETAVCALGQEFMAHTDCHRYYICIASLAIPISCPERMAWDNSILQCTEEALVSCEA